MTPLVSVVMPVYNGEAFLAEAMASVLAQTLSDWELVVVDDRSTDRTVEVARSFSDPRVRVEVNAENLGLYPNTNRAAGLARGRFIKVLYQDDRLLPECLAKMVKAAETAPTVGVVACRRRLIDERGSSLGEIPRVPASGFLPRAEAFRLLLSHGNFPGEPSSALFSAALLRELGGFDPAHTQLGDIDFWARSLAGHDLFLFREPLVEVRRHGGQETEKMRRRFPRLFDEYRRLAETMGKVGKGLGFPRPGKAQAVCAARFFNTTLAAALRSPRLFPDQLGTFWRGAGPGLALRSLAASALLALRRLLVDPLLPAGPEGLPSPLPTRENAVAVVVTFHPDREFPARLKTMVALGLPLVVVENGSTPEEKALVEKAAAQAGAEVIAHDRNLGIAAALNRGAVRARERGAAWVLAFDQDSLPEPHLFDTLGEAFAAHPRRHLVAIVGPNYLDPRKGLAPRFSPGKGLFREQKTVITSGSLFPLAAFDRVGPFREELFIDHVDHEWCLRARSLGYRIVLATRPALRHSIGRRTEHLFLGLPGSTRNYPPSRRYLMGRNFAFLLRGHLLAEPLWTARAGTGHVVELARILLFENDKLRKIRYYLRGFSHGLRRDLSRQPGSEP